MMNTLTQRYVSAAVAGLPEPQRDDVAKELQASVADAVEDLTAAGLSREQAEIRALTELGDPAVLAERFGGRPRHLIGPAYFGQYARLLRTLLIVVVPIVGLVTLAAQALAGASPVNALLSASGVMFQVGVQVAFWVTVVFAVLERSHSPLAARPWTPDELPEVVEHRIGLAETVAGIGILIVGMWALVWQRDHWLVTVDGVEVPVLNPAVWTPWMLLLLAVLALSIVLEIITYRVGHWTVALAVVNTGLNVAFVAIVTGLWAKGILLTPGVAELMPTALLNPLPWIVVAIAVVDTVDSWRGVARH